VLADFRARIARAGKSIEAENIAAGQGLPHADASAIDIGKQFPYY
jgi:hypothetical protein